MLGRILSAGARPHLRITLLMLLAGLLAVGCGLDKPKGQVKFITVDTDPDWSPDGRLIAFASSRRLGGIHLIQPDGKRLRQLFHGVASNVDWSPDSRRIAFQGDDGIYVLPRGGGHPMRLLQGDFLLPAWSPDGRKLAVVKQERDLSTAIYVVGLDGSGLRRLLPPFLRRSGPHWDAVSETEPAWSPDGRQIAFQTGDGHIVTADIALGKRRTIAATGYEPAWSPDGRSIAFESGSALWLANADGSGEKRLLASEGRDPSWAPDSRTLVFEVRHFYGREWRRPQSLSVVDAAGTLSKLTYGTLCSTILRGAEIERLHDRLMLHRSLTSASAEQSMVERYGCRRTLLASSRTCRSRTPRSKAHQRSSTSRGLPRASRSSSAGRPWRQPGSRRGGRGRGLGVRGQDLHRCELVRASAAVLREGVKDLVAQVPALGNTTRAR